MWQIIVLWCALISAAIAATVEAPLQPKPYKYRNVPGCYVQELDAVIPVGVTRPAPPPACMLYRCQEDYLEIDTCGAVGRSSSSRIQHSRLPYPNCCPKCRV